MGKNVLFIVEIGASAASAEVPLSMLQSGTHLRVFVCAERLRYASRGQHLTACSPYEEQVLKEVLAASRVRLRASAAAHQAQRGFNRCLRCPGLQHQPSSLTCLCDGGRHFKWLRVAFCVLSACGRELVR